MTISETWTVVPTDVGDLRALVQGPADPTRACAAVVLVDGSGEGACDDWGEWPTRFADCGALVLMHDKPGCGGSPGDWTTQSLLDRARETLAAARVLKEHPLAVGRPIGLIGFSQGGWVSLLAATLDESCVDFVVSLSGPGVTPAEQERYRIEHDLRLALSEPEVSEALAWIDERTSRLLAGEEVTDVLADQERYADRSWYQAATQYFDNPIALGFLARVLDFDPAPVLRDIHCPVLALFGADDTLVPVPESVAGYLSNLPQQPGNPHGVAVFPGANHGLFTADPDPAIPRTNQLAAGFLPMVSGFLLEASHVAP